MARLLTNLLLLNLGFPILTIKAETGKDRTKYVQAMKAADNHDHSKLESLCRLGKLRRYITFSVSQFG